MICPSCKSDIADGSIICPICNTQFAFTVPGVTQTSNPNMYEVVKNEVKSQVGPEESAYSPSSTALPTEVSHYPEEEINPEANALKYSHMVDQSEGEYMHIHGRDISHESYMPGNSVAIPLRPEVPMGVQQPIQPQASSIPQQPASPMNQMSQMNQQVLGMQMVNQGTQQSTMQQPIQQSMVQQPMQSNNVNNVQNNNKQQSGQLASQLIKNGMPVQPQQPAYQSPILNTPLYHSTVSSTKKKIRPEDIFFLGVSVVGIIVMIIIVVSLITNSNKGNQPIAYSKKGNVYDQTVIETNNIGNRSTYNAPMKIGNTTLATIYDTLNQGYVDVDVTGVRFIEGTEAKEYAKNYAKDDLIPGFEWYGFEYKVKFNDLKNLSGNGISPVLNSKLYRWNGCDFVTYNEKNYSLKTYNIYTGETIKNTQTANVIVLYQIPPEQTEYSICFGYLEKTLGCFSKYSK